VIWLDPTLRDFLAGRRPMALRVLAWLTVRDLSDGTPVAVGFWSGAQDTRVAVFDPATGGSEERLFHGAGSLLSAAAQEQAAGLDIWPAQITLSPIDATVELAVRGYDVRHAPITVYLGYQDPEAQGFVAPPAPAFEGWVNAAPIQTPAPGGEASLSLTLVPRSRALTVGNPARSSDAQQRLRAGDRILRYADIGHLVPLAWGEKSARISGNKGGSVT
jgi:hypothetical protein